MGLKTIAAKRAELDKQTAELKAAASGAESAVKQWILFSGQYHRKLEELGAEFERRRKETARDINGLDFPNPEMAKLKLELIQSLEQGGGMDHERMTARSAELITRITRRIGSLDTEVEARVREWIAKNEAAFPKKLAVGNLFKNKDGMVAEVVSFEVDKHSPPHKPSYESVTVEAIAADGTKKGRRQISGLDLNKWKFIDIA